MKIKKRITEAFHRIRLDEPNYIWIEVLEKTLILKGFVKSWENRDDLEAAARSVPGIDRIINNLETEKVSKF